ncbi:MAG: winged helix-turn-helix transcriptional regulator, partial [Bacteroidales bacterium]|nr:winged helix-turn-helix transcriptional regulator [Bacteroidales bacterium]
KSTPNTNPKEEKSTPKRLGVTAQSILDILSEDPYLKREEIAARAGLKLEGLKYQLAQLQKKGYLLRIEGRKNGHWKVLIKK